MHEVIEVYYSKYKHNKDADEIQRAEDHMISTDGHRKMIIVNRGHIDEYSIDNHHYKSEFRRSHAGKGKFEFPFQMGIDIN